MGKINVLSFEVANLIAAGEVVDRPASVIKELMENSIDAGAKKITVEIKNGGVSYMRVSDDGCGIAPEDMPLALKRHATSKIASAEDLAAIFTLGFRGEALAAISSVSKVRILSKTAEAANGAMLYADGGRIVSVGEAGCPSGTTITVEQLFANVPARRKFLKKDATESAAVAASVEKIALSHPEIAIRLIMDGNIRLDTAGDGKLENTIYSVLGRDFARRMLPVKCRSEGVEVHGFIGTPDNVKPTRNFQNFFINNRYVKSRTAMAALEQAFSSYIAPERFPACVLFIDVNPAAVDVNVHPAKLEVKFSNEKIIFDTVYYAVRSALEKNTDRPDLVLRSDPAVEMHTSNAFVPVMDRFSYLAAMPEQGRIDRMGASPSAMPQIVRRLSVLPHRPRRRQKLCRPQTTRRGLRRRASGRTARCIPLTRPRSAYVRRHLHRQKISVPLSRCRPMRTHRHLLTMKKQPLLRTKKRLSARIFPLRARHPTPWRRFCRCPNTELSASHSIPTFSSRPTTSWS